ncbi:MAG: acyltransferase [Candidatus Zambryskibacteria bacterium]|nr:acyltransferase [Candidatus Zambryskibacteria bacterium]
MNKVYFKNLDGLRFFAFLIVLISHLTIFSGYTAELYNPIRKLFFAHGDLGVTFFFVLSGFLITYLLLQEREQTGDVSIKHFYIRRALRIWPVYLVVILCGFFIFPYLISTPLSVSLLAPLSRLPAYLFFLGNIDLIYAGYTSVIIGVLWSLAVEEQFYLVWPAVFKRVGVSKIPWILGAVIIASFIYRFIRWQNYEIIRYMTFSVFSDIAIGCLLAYCVYFKKGFVEFFENMPRWAIGLSYVMVVYYTLLRGILSFLVSGLVHQTLYALESIIFCVLFSIIILEQCYSKNSFFKVGNSKILSYLGKLSYGLYAYHMVALVCVLWATSIYVPVVHSSLPTLVFVSVFTFLLSLFFAHISYTYMEKPILKLKEKVGYVK